MSPARPSRASIWAALVAVYFFWGSTFLGIRFAIESFPPFLMASARFALAGVILVGWARFRGAPWPTARQWGLAAVVGILLLGAGNGSVVWAEQYLPSGLVSLAVSSSPIWMVLIDRFVFGGRTSWPALVGVGVGFAGIFLLVNPNTSSVPLLPAAVLAVSSVAWAGGTLFSRHARLPESTTLSNGMEMLGGALVLAIGAGVNGDFAHVDIAHASIRSIAGVTWLVIFGSLVGFSCYLWLIRVAPVVLVSTQSYVSPVVAVLLGLLLAGEHLSARSLVAGGVILAGVCVIVSAPLIARRGLPGPGVDRPTA